MNNYQEFDIFLNIGPKEISISAFDKRSNQIYQDIFTKDSFLPETDQNILSGFLDKNIFKLEKLTKIFVKKINLVVDSNLFNSVSVSIKRKSFGKKITLNEMKQMLHEIKEEVKENNLDSSIIHMLIEHYEVDNQRLKHLDYELSCDNLIVQIQFICLSNYFIKNLNTKFKHYQIEIGQILSASYVKNHNSEGSLTINQAALKIFKGENFNEVQIVPKNSTKMGFFEKFFNLFD